MADTLTFVFDASNQYLRLAEQTINQLEAITSQMNSVDPNSPNAQARVDQLSAKYFAVQDRARNELLALSQEFDTAYNQLNPILKKNGVLISAVDDMRAFRVKLGTTRDAFETAETRKEQQINAANAPKPPITSPKPANTNITNTTNTTSAAATTVVTTPNSVTVTTEQSTTTTTSGSKTITVPPTTSAPNTTGTTPPASTTGSATPGAPAKEPKTVLKFGDQIDDIYDKTLTPEQIASLSPGDRKAREAGLADSNTNADTAQNEIVVTATRSAVEFDTQAKASAQDAANFESFEDWRVRLTLAPDAEYLYRASNPGIMAPLAATDGVIFPYTPLISVNYAAKYDTSTVVHSNYQIYQYTSSSVDQVTISCDFTAQDTSEANYILATIHFFRSMTKMFYGQDQYPKPGTPPPLCFLFGLGGFQFDAHPLVITGFSYNLPNDVDYIRTTTTIDSTSVTKNGYSETAGNGRLPTGVLPGGVAPGATFDNDGGGFSPTYVPTKIQLSITAYPIVSRNQISNKFSLTDYATGKLLQGSQRQGGGIW